MSAARGARGPLGTAAALLLLLLACGAAPARGNPLDAFGFGARAPALGSAYAAVADDAAAGYYNPAGLARAELLRIDVGYQAALPAVQLGGVTQPLEATRGLAVGLVMPGSVLGVHFGFGVTLFLPDQHVTRIRVLGYDQPRLQMYDNRTQRFYMAANLAVRLYRGLYVGAGLTFMSRTQGTVSLRGNVTIGDADNSALSAAIDVDLLAVRYPQAGLVWEATRSLTLALCYRHRFVLDVDQGFNIKADVGNPGMPPAVPGAVLMEQALSVDLFQPWQLVLGGAVRFPRAHLLVSADLTFARWSEMPAPAATFNLVLDIGRLNDLAHIPAPATFPDPGFHDILIPALGVEWRALDGMLDDRLALDLRGGYRYEASPVPDQPGESSFGDADKHIFSLGAGVVLQHLARALPHPLALDVFVALHYLPERSFLKSDPRSPIGDFTVRGSVGQIGGMLRWQL